MLFVKRKIIYIILAFVFFLGAVTFYVNRVVIPKHLRTVIPQSLAKYLGRKVALKNIRFDPFRGFILDGLVIYETGSDDVFATIDQAAAGFHYLPLILNRKIVLSSFEVRRVSAHLIHYAADQWNYTDIVDLIASRQDESKSKSVPVYLSHIEMTGGKIKVTDLEDGAQSSETFENANIKADLSLSRGIIFQMSTQIPHQQGWIECKGRYHLLKKSFRGQIKMNNVPLAQYVKLTRIELPLDLKNVYVFDLNAVINWTPDRVEAEGFGSLKDLDLELSPEKTVKTEALVVQKSNFAFEGQRLSASGIGWAKNPRIVIGPKTYTASKAQMELANLSIQDNMLSATGTTTIEGASFEAAGQPSFQGDLHINNIKIAQTNDSWTTNADLQANSVSIVFTPETKLTGDFTSSSLTVTTGLKTAALKGKLDGQNIMLQWPTGKELHGAVTLDNIVVENEDIENSPWKGQANLTGRGITIKLPDEKTFATEAASTVSLRLQTTPRRVDVQSDFQLTQSVFTMKNGVTFQGDPAGKLEVHADEKPNTSAAYEGSFKLDNADLNGTPIGDIGGIKGSISFKNDQAWTSELTFNALGMPARLKGKLHDFGRPSVDVDINVERFDLTKAPVIVPRFFSQNQLTIEGTAEKADISYKGLISDAANADVRFTAHLTGASLNSGKLNQSASELFGRIDYKKDFFAWKNLKALYRDKNYVLTGRLTDFHKPRIETTLASKNLKLTTHFDYTDQMIAIDKLTGIYEHMVFDVKGTSKPSGDGRPLLDLTGDVEVDLEHLPALVPSWAEQLKPYRLSGDLKIKGQFAGDPVHWQDWRFNLTGGSPQFYMWGLKIRNLKFNAVQKDNRIKPLHVWGNFYGGEFNAIASVDLAKEDLPCDFIMRISNADLSQLKGDTPFKKQDIDGKLSSTLLLEGPAVDLRKLKGKGGIQINEGRLWELDLLKGLGGILLIPEYKNIVFNEAGMNFTVNEGLVLTENLQLLSKSLTLYGRGNMDFDQNINLILTPDFNTSVIADSASLKKGSTAIITGTQQFMSIDVTGTLSKPQYKVNKSPGRILQKTGGIILENVSGFFKNIF